MASRVRLGSLDYIVLAVIYLVIVVASIVMWLGAHWLTHIAMAWVGLM